MASNIIKALICSKYGPPPTLRVQKIEKPTPKENEVLVKVHATAVNDYDWSLLSINTLEKQ